MTAGSTMKPLAGLQVLDFTKVIAGPLCTQYLADLGADVIKVETTDGGDDTRRWAPLRDGTGAAFSSLNRGKRSIVVDLKTEDGRAVAHRLAERADVVVESFAPGVTARLGVDDATLRRGNPRLVYCSISGFGQTGPLRAARGFDNILQAFSGMMAMNGERGSGPVRIPISPIDQVTGLNAVIGIQAALQAREQTGRGSYLEVSLFESAVAMLGFTLQAYWEDGAVPARIGSAHPSICPYQVFDTADTPVLIGVANDRLWGRFCTALDHPELAADPRFRTNPDRVAHYAETVGTVAEIIRRHPSAHWVERLAANDVPCTPVNTVEQMLAHEHTAARGIILEHRDPAAAGLKAVATPIVFDGAQRDAGTPPPGLGQHTREVLAQVGYTAEEIAALELSGGVATQGGT